MSIGTRTNHFMNTYLHIYESDLIVQCVMPGMVQTKMTGLKRSSFMAPNPERFVQVCFVFFEFLQNGFK